MRTQITRAIIGVAVLLVIGLGAPLAIVVQRFYEDRAVADLQRRAAETINEIALPLDRAELATVAAEPDAPGEFSVYDRSADLVFGPGPAAADAVVRIALGGRSNSATVDGELVLAAPLTQRTSETVVGAVRVTQGSAVVDGQVRRSWLAMGGAVIVALTGATLLARAQGRRLAEPVVRLARHADELGRGEFGAGAPPSGIAEVDTVAESLAASGDRLALILARERAFSADVAHQLRTPLTGLRLRLERLSGEPGAVGELEVLLSEVARLEETVEHLLALSRDRQPVASSFDVGSLLAEVAHRWTPLFPAERRLVIHDDSVGTVRGTERSIAQVLDVLVDNGLRHGAGDVSVRARRTAGGAVIEVADEGEGPADDVDDVFERRHSPGGHGIGLALARSITEAEGGRLLLATRRPPSFHLVVSLSDEGGSRSTKRS